MTDENLQQNYSTFAEKYDQLFDDNMYEAWLAFVKVHTTKGTILDLGGGAGRLAVLLAEDGYAVDVLDLSADMLTLAQRHAQAAKVDINLLQADMRDWSDWPKIYDTIISFADAFNYLPTLHDFKAALAQAAQHLNTGGQLLFDVITPYQVNELYQDYYYNNDDDADNIFMWTSYPGDSINSVDHDLKFFVYDEAIDGFKILREIHHEQTYDLIVYQQALEEAGFKDVQVMADFGIHSVNDETSRWFFKAVKI
ncbi:class I SAM-dependent DNA methyltransferase [Leuconostoc citreum]|uniref:SAM-dependent methyltransferase n=1 Tax=Leuconostoc citreum (strain KM20) TaxID=349519 RepID=B1MXH9_LEUCK|nr:class I SAM-dependent methyltransferase [Leuconostoc citreum]ACA82231.1 SAM-dependent methyltransferase [Leuconostoc citreum KM20]